MSAPRIILASLPSFCQKVSKLVEILRSSGKTILHSLFLRHGVYGTVITARAPALFQCIRGGSLPDASVTDHWRSYLVLHAWFSRQYSIYCCVRRTAVLPPVPCCFNVTSLGNADQCDSSHCCFTGW